MRYPVAYAMGVAAALLAVAAGAAELRLALVNRTPATLECHAVAGHWYGFDLGTIRSGGRLRVGFGLDRTTGTITLPNSLGQALPIQYVYCGAAGDAWRTRADLPLRRLADGATDSTLAVICQEGARGLACQ